MLTKNNGTPKGTLFVESAFYNHDPTRWDAASIQYFFVLTESKLLWHKYNNLSRIEYIDNFAFVKRFFICFDELSCVQIVVCGISQQATNSLNRLNL